MSKQWVGDRRVTLWVLGQVDDLGPISERTLVELSAKDPIVKAIPARGKLVALGLKQLRRGGQVIEYPEPHRKKGTPPTPSRFVTPGKDLASDIARILK